MMELNYLANIINDISNGFGRERMPYRHELKRELLNLSDYEKQVLKNKVSSMDYNIGTLNMIRLLNECEITSISEYLNKVGSLNEQLSIITDILDDKGSYALLEELMDSNLFEDLLDVAIKNYINDLINRQEIIQNEIVTATEQLLTSENFTRCILQKFISNLFMMDFKHVNDLTDIISNQKDWNLEFLSFRLLRKIFEDIMPTHNSLIIKEICNCIQNEKQLCWFFIIMAVGFLKEEYDGYVELKNLIQLHINAFCESINLNSLYKSLILARQIYHYSDFSSKKQTYQQWLKNNIGDLNYKLKNKTAFCEIIQSLENLVPFENDLDVLKVHIACQISAPRKEYNRVVEYKQLLRSREENLKLEDNEFTEMLTD